MSNAMLHWDGEMKKARVTARLKALSPQARTSFGAGSLFHAYEGVRVTTECVKSGGAVVKSLDRAFGTLWEGVGHGSAHALGGPDVKDELERHAPGEDDPSLPGQADLVDGVLRLLNLRRDHKPADAFEMARFAYQAITEVVSRPSAVARKLSGRQSGHPEPACERSSFSSPTSRPWRSSAAAMSDGRTSSRGAGEEEAGRPPRPRLGIRADTAS
jgi:hypothetical protein